jgi:translation elongation factor EF-Ts
MGNTLASAVFYEGTDENVAKDCALQVAAMAPEYVSVQDVILKQKLLKEEFKNHFKMIFFLNKHLSKILLKKLKKLFQNDLLSLLC